MIKQKRSIKFWSIEEFAYLENILVSTGKKV